MKRNILLITSDQWRGDCLSAFGHPCLDTPNYDKLVSDGVSFRNHYTVCAPCGPARASLLTGMYMQNHRSVNNGTPLDHRFQNIARLARHAGYSPTLFGYTDTSLDPRVYSRTEVMSYGYENMLPGFEEGLLLAADQPDPWLKYLESKGYGSLDADTAFRPINEQGDTSRHGHTPAPPCFSASDSQTAFLTRHAMEFIGQQPGDWFVHLSYLRPHPPFIAPEPYNTMYDPQQVPHPVGITRPPGGKHCHPWLASAHSAPGAGFDPLPPGTLPGEDYDLAARQLRATYYGLVSKVDHYIGELIQHLKQLGQYDNTLIVLTSDHGELLGDNWLYGKRGYFDSAYHIPLILRAPDQPASAAGRQVNAFTESVDVMPTIVEWMGLEPSRQCDGRSLLPLVQGTTPTDWRTEAHWEYDFRAVSDPTLEQSLGIAMDQCQLNVIRNEHYKYVHFAALPPLLFDLEQDPGEENDLANHPDYAGVMLELSQKMLSWRMQNDERTLTGIEVSRQGIESRGY